MSDLEKWQSLFTECGIGFDNVTSPAFPGRRFIEIKAKEHAKVVGYTGFCAVMQFDDSGSLINMEIAE